MISQALMAHLDTARGHMLSWAGSFAPEQRAHLAEPAIALEVDKLSYIDGWRRIRRTTPLCLKVIERFDSMGDIANVRAWIEDLDEEAGHDLIMRDDLVRLFGGEEELQRALDANPITPPSTALLGYFEWQAIYGDPHMVAALRLFLEWHFATMEQAARDGVQALVPGGSKTMEIHVEKDKLHVSQCLSYLDSRCSEKDLPNLIWSIDFSGLCLREAQIWIASGVLGQLA